MFVIDRHLRGPKHNIGKELFEPCFKDCELYRRQTAFFQPSVFKCWSASIEELVKNETKIEILMAFSPDNSRVFDLIENLQTKHEKERLIHKEANSLFLNCLGLAAGSEDYKNRNRLIRYLYAKGLLEIKLCIPKNPDPKDTGLSHEKAGYFVNKVNGRKILFNGSMNESESALMRNGEHITVYDSLKDKDQEDIQYFTDDLDDKWNEVDAFTDVFSPSKEVIKLAKSKSDIKSKKEALMIAKIIKEEDELKKLRAYQEDALESWKENEFRGILDHATGSGKTFTAMKGMEALRRGIDQLHVVVAVPYVALAEQWQDELDEFFESIKDIDEFEFNGSIGCFSGQGDYVKTIKKESLKFHDSLISKKGHLSIYVVVNDTFTLEKFNSIFLDENLINPERLFFVGDECHRFANKNLLDNVNENARFRLGLSATAFDKPDQLNPLEKKMKEYFGDICHSYTLEDGIQDGYLCKYIYKPQLVYIDDEDFIEWQEYLDRYNLKDDSESDEAFLRMTEIINRSQKKYESFNKLLKKIDDKQHSIIFCGQEKVDEINCIDYVSTLLDNQDWRHSKITYNENKNTRKEIIKSFTRGDTESICAIRVLDEGIDIPLIKTAIILASSEKRRQFIQRRGRVLRTNKDKELATIYDFVVLPNTKFGDQGKNWIARETKRVEELGKDAINKEEIIDFIKKYKGLYEAL